MKCLKINCHKQGSAYLSVLLVILITGVLGVGLMTFTLSNLKASTGVFADNNMFYKTEASVSAVQVQIEQQVRKAQETAKAEVELNRDDIIQRATFFDEESGFETFDEALFLNEYEKFFCDSFNKYMCQGGEENGRSIILNLKNTVSGIINISVPQYDIDLMNNPKQELFITVDAEKIENAVKKTVTARFKILREPAISLKKVHEKRRNPIWMRAITTEGDLIAVGGRVTLNSSESDEPLFKKADAVYVWGKNNYRVDGTNATGDKYGGIIAGVNQTAIDSLGLGKFGLTSQSGDIKIKGETFTDAYIHTFGDNSSIFIDVNNGQSEAVDNIGNDLTVPKVFAESLQTEDFSNYNSIRVDGDVILKDDLEQNGSYSTIDISGSFLGISSGPDSDFSNDKFANRSSSITYNDPLETSNINIGKYVVVSGVAYNNNVIYNVDPFKGTPYKTGESVGLSENHKIYRYYFSGEDINGLFDNGYNIDIEGELFDYPLFSGKTGAPPNGVGTKRVERFRDYLIKYYEKTDSLDYAPNLADRLINIGYNNDNKIEGYSLGVLPANGKLYVPLVLSDVHKSSKAYISGLLKDFDYIYNSNLLNSLKTIWKERYNKETWIANKKDERKVTSEFDSLVDYSINYNADTSNGDNSIILKVEDGVLNIDMSAINDKGGLIFAKGNIIISGSGEFNGSIVASGSIIFKGSGNKTITYNEKNVLQAIRLNENVRAFFSKGGMEEIDPDSMEIELKAQRNVIIDDYREIK